MGRYIWPDPLGTHRARTAEIARFALTGGAAYLVDVIGFNMAVLLGCGHLEAKLFSGLAAMAVAYAGSRYFTWPGRRRPGGHPFVVFVVVSAVASGIQLACLWLTHDVAGWTSLAADNISANVIGMGLATLFRYWGFRRLVFGVSAQPRRIRRPAADLAGGTD